ncbi:MAG: hypothetical protein A2512_06975 [Deltaproteobacteria bacterium RIFOXYD12_FULL_56_24]|nr:MAG: hypothetical protein A2512_06975 [Deltaproteobacteria bacterium RIFOXYD12_FULL_56_24]
MKKPAYIPAMFALFFLVDGCSLPAVHDPTARPNQETKAATSPSPEKPAPPIRLETKSKPAPLIPKDNASQTARKIPPAKAVAQSPEAHPAQTPPHRPPAPPQPQVFTDYQTGLAFSYHRPWHLVSTKGDGPVLGRDGHSQLTSRFATLTTDKDKGEHRGYFHVPDDSLSGKIGKTLKSILGTEDSQATPEATPLDVLLTQKHFPDLIIEKRYRGNNGGMVVQKCRHKQLPGPFQVYHVFIGDKVASFSLSDLKNRRLKLEMQQIVFSTRKL